MQIYNTQTLIYAKLWGVPNLKDLKYNLDAGSNRPAEMHTRSVCYLIYSALVGNTLGV